MGCFLRDMLNILYFNLYGHLFNVHGLFFITMMLNDKVLRSYNNYKRILMLYRSKVYNHVDSH